MNLKVYHGDDVYKSFKGSRLGAVVFGGSVAAYLRVCVVFG
jgi:hypothetical protein